MARYGFRMIANGFVILKYGHAMFPEDVVKDIKVLSRERDYYKRLSEAAEERFNAAEKFIEIKDEYYLKINDLDNGELSDMEHEIYKSFKKWQQSIADYDAAVKGEGE